MSNYILIVSGMVQNVCFRNRVKQFAEQNSIYGQVKNLANKSVKIDFSGNEKNLNLLLDFIKSNPGNSKVDHISIKKVNYLKKFDRFKILY